MDYKIFKLILLNHNNEEKVTHYYTSKKSESKDSNTHVIKLYGDDTIENIKYKLCSVLQDTNIDHYSFHYKTKEILDPKVKFKKMSKGLNFIQKDDFKIFCLNRNITFDESKEEYSFDDFFKFCKSFMDKDVYSVTRSFDIHCNNEKCIYNPLENITNDFYKKMETIHSKLLFELGEIIDNTIYAIHKDEYKIFIENNKLNYHVLVPFYYPFLDKQTKNLEDKYNEYNQVITNHNKLFNKCKLEEKKKKLIENPQINSFEFIYKNSTEFIFPLEIFFKKVHSTKDNPFIQYKLDHSHETIYRLFAPKLDFQGRKKPYLSKDKILRIGKKFVRKNCVSFCYYIQKEKRLKNTSVYVSIDNVGNIYILIENVKSELDVKEICLSILNKTISMIIKIIDPAKLMYNQIESLDHENIEILELIYEIPTIPYSKNIIKNVCKNYFQSLFQVNTSNSDLILNYKRVSNYNKMDDMNAVVIKMINKNEDTSAIIQKLKFYFNNDEEKARNELTNIYSYLRISDHLERDGEKKRKIHIQYNPGFLIYFKGGGKDSKIIIENINHFDYIHYIKNFLRNLIYISSITNDNKKKQHLDLTYFNKKENSPILSTIAPEVQIESSIRIDDEKEKQQNIENRPDDLRLNDNESDNDFYKQLNQYSNTENNQSDNNNQSQNNNQSDNNNQSFFQKTNKESSKQILSQNNNENDFPNLINGGPFLQNNIKENFSSLKDVSPLKSVNSINVAKSIRPQENNSVIENRESELIPTRKFDNNNKNDSSKILSLGEQGDDNKSANDEDESKDENSLRFMDGWANSKTPPDKENNKSALIHN